MPVTFPITVTPPDAPVEAEIERLLQAARHPAGDFAGLSARAVSNLKVAAIQWGGCFRPDESVDITLVFEMPENGEDRATGFSNGSADLGKAPHYPDCTLGMEGAAAQISGAGVPDKTGITIKLRAGNYLVNDVWFDPDPVGRSHPVPAGLVDGVTLFLHEMGHALGFNGWLTQETKIPRAQWGKPDGGWVSRYDDWVTFDGANFFFHGPAAMAANDGKPVPLSDLQGDNNNYCHVGNDAGTCRWCRCDLMTGYPWEVGRRYGISRLDLAILKDVGLPVV
jgi:hypothetical protein